MYVPPLHLSNSFDSYISGEVIIHPSAVLAPGVILQAVPNSKIIIGPGVCIGMGSILQVHEGTLEVEVGANLGSGFLMVGQGKIGANACIGSATTVFNCSVEPGQVVPPGSILGDTSRRVVTTETPVLPEDDRNGSRGAEVLGGGEEKASVILPGINLTDVADSATVKLTDQASVTSEKPAVVTSESNHQSKDLPTVQPPQQLPTPSTPSQNNSITHIYGQQNIQRLLITLFPHRQPSTTPKSDEPTES